MTQSNFGFISFHLVLNANFVHLFAILLNSANRMCTFTMWIRHANIQYKFAILTSYLTLSTWPTLFENVITSAQPFFSDNLMYFFHIFKMIFSCCNKLWLSFVCSTLSTFVWMLIFACNSANFFLVEQKTVTASLICASKFKYPATTTAKQ